MRDYCLNSESATEQKGAMKARQPLSFIDLNVEVQML